MRTPVTYISLGPPHPPLASSKEKRKRKKRMLLEGRKRGRRS
jgi:hypothetical protein